MEWAARLFVSAILLRAVQGCPESDLVATPCNVTLTTLDDLYKEGLAADNDTVCVHLAANSRHSLTYRNTSLSFSAIIIKGNNSTVTCDEADLEALQNLSYTHFPLRFQGANMVVITDLNFEGCKRPLQFKMVLRVLISSSSFW